MHTISFHVVGVLLSVFSVASIHPIVCMWSYLLVSIWYSFYTSWKFKAIKRGFRWEVASGFRIRMKRAKSTIILHRCMLWCTRCNKMISYKQMRKYTYLIINHFWFMFNPLSINLKRIWVTFFKQILLNVMPKWWFN